MPTLCSVKDGRRPDTQRGPGITVSFSQLEAAFAGNRVVFVSAQPPEFNAERPSQFPVHVVVEVEVSDGWNASYSKPGFYLMEGLSPQQAQNRLEAVKAK